MEVYLDNSATTLPYKEVVDTMSEVMMSCYGNPSSMHIVGIDAEKRLNNAIKTISDNLKCKPSEILVTSGGTESDNMALIGVAKANHRTGKHIITSKIEHPAILETCAYLEKEGFEISYIGTNEYGVIDVDELVSLVRNDTILVSIMHTNNEIGSLQPIADISVAVKKKNPNTLIHVDAVQGYGKFSVIPKKMGIDLMSVSAHKIHGPRGVGFLYIKDKTKINPIIFGGGQQKGMRSGTENVAGICGMAKAVLLSYESLEADRERLYDLKEYFIKGLLEIENVKINGVETEQKNNTDTSEANYVAAAQMKYEELNTSVRKTAPHIVSASFEGIRSEVLLHALEDKGIYVSSGSACASNRPHVSSTLLAIGLEQKYLDSTIRFSFSVKTTSEEVDYTLDVLNKLVPLLRKYTRH